MKNNLSYQQRREQLKKQIENIGSWNINKTQLAQQFNVSRQQIHKDVNHILKALKNQDGAEIIINIRAILRLALRKNTEILVTSHETKDVFDASKTIAVLCNALSNYVPLSEEDKLSDKKIIVSWKDNKEQERQENNLHDIIERARKREWEKEEG